MRILYFILIILFAFMNFNCNTIAVVVDYDRQNDFSKYKSYKYIKQKGTKITSKFQNDMNRKRFAEAIESELSQKGFNRISDTPADFKVVYHLRLEQKLDVSSYGYRYLPAYGITETYVQTKVYQQGSVIIDIIEANKNQLVWRGSAEGVLNENSDADEIIKDVVKQILESFPPSIKIN